MNAKMVVAKILSLIMLVGLSFIILNSAVLLFLMFFYDSLSFCLAVLCLILLCLLLWSNFKLKGIIHDFVLALFLPLKTSTENYCVLFKGSKVELLLSLFIDVCVLTWWVMAK